MKKDIVKIENEINMNLDILSIINKKQPLILLIMKK